MPKDYDTTAWGVSWSCTSDNADIAPGEAVLMAKRKKKPRSAATAATTPEDALPDLRPKPLPESIDLTPTEIHRDDDFDPLAFIRSRGAVENSAPKKEKPPSKPKLDPKEWTVAKPLVTKKPLVMTPGTQQFSDTTWTLQPGQELTTGDWILQNNCGTYVKIKLNAENKFTIVTPLWGITVRKSKLLDLTFYTIEDA